MSIKTLRKRIALVAVSALGAGLMSVVAVPSANAAAELTVTTTTGVVVAPTTSASVGTGTIVSTGTVQLAVAAAAASTAIQVRISGGTFIGVTSGADISADGTKATNNANATAIAGLIAKPTSAGRDMVIKTYLDASATAAVDTSGLNDATTYHSIYTFTVIAAGTNGVFNSGLSSIAIVNSASTGSSTTNADTPYANIVGEGGTGVISYTLRDANNNNLPSTAIVYARIKSGDCVIGLSTAPTAGTMVVGVAPTDLIYVAQADGESATTCAVDIEVDGVLAATKTFTFQGPVEKITVTSLGIAQSSGARTGLGYLVATDSAGNQIGNVSVSGIILDSSKSGIVSAVSVASATTSIASVNDGTAPATVPVTVGWTCGSTVGSAPVLWRTSNGTGGYINSPTYEVKCAGAPVTYTASLDKASYVPGDVATLTITGKDSKGLASYDAFVIGSGSAGEVMSLSGSQLTQVGAVSTDTFTNGTKTYKFIVGTTEGSYNMVVDIPLILTATNKATYGAAAQTVAYKVSSGVTGVTNAEVLAAIVKLIASINKQIRALQKSLKRK